MLNGKDIFLYDGMYSAQFKTINKSKYSKTFVKFFMYLLL